MADQQHSLISGLNQVRNERRANVDQDRINFKMWKSTGLYSTKEPLDPSVRKLARAILRQAVRDMLMHQDSASGQSDDWGKDAAQWFFSDETDPGSLTWVCDILQLQPWMLRQWLSVYYQSHQQRRELMVMELFRSLRPSMN